VRHDWEDYSYVSPTSPRTAPVRRQFAALGATQHQAVQRPGAVCGTELAGNGHGGATPTTGRLIHRNPAQCAAEGAASWGRRPDRRQGKNDSARKWRVRYSTPSPETRGGSRNPQPGYRKRFGIRGWSTTQPKLWSTTDHHSTCGCSCADIGNLRGHRDTRAA
jgi:hypothetical protein